MADDPNFIFNRMGTYYANGASPILAVELGMLPIDQFHSAAIAQALQTLTGGSSAGSGQRGGGAAAVGAADAGPSGGGPL